MRIYTVLVCLLLTSKIISQNISRNTVFAEAFGAAGYYSANYERLLRDNNNVNFTLRAGFSYIPEHISYPYQSSSLIIPMGFSMLKNIDKNHFIEIRASIANIFFYETIVNTHSRGLGAPTHYTYYTYDEEFKYEIYPSLGLGYRYQPKNKGLFFNFLAQRITHLTKELWYTNLSVGLGYAF